MLARIGATPGIRLACQVRPTHDLAVVPLLPASAGPAEGQVRINPGHGIEREVAVLFADLRAFTRMAEGRLPYDVVFVLNQYFKAMGGVIEQQGGRIDKFIGDGVMALFGLERGPEDACLQALSAARAMAAALARLNRRLEHDLREPLQIGIGLHVGPVILGHMGYGRAATLTAIGDTVNVASRLETLTKELEVELVVSSRLAEAAGVDLGALRGAPDRDPRPPPAPARAPGGRGRRAAARGGARGRRERAGPGLACEPRTGDRRPAIVIGTHVGHRASPT